MCIGARTPVGHRWWKQGTRRSLLMLCIDEWRAFEREILWIFMFFLLLDQDQSSDWAAGKRGQGYLGVIQENRRLYRRACLVKYAPRKRDISNRLICRICVNSPFHLEMYVWIFFVVIPWCALLRCCIALSISPAALRLQMCLCKSWTLCESLHRKLQERKSPSARKNMWYTAFAKVFTTIF